MTPYPWRELAEYVEADALHRVYVEDSAGVFNPEPGNKMIAALRAYLAAVDAWRAKGGEKPEPPVSTTPACDCRDGLVTAPSGRDMLCPKCHPNPAPERTWEERTAEDAANYIERHGYVSEASLIRGLLAQYHKDRAEVSELKAQVERLTNERDRSGGLRLDGATGEAKCVGCGAVVFTCHRPKP